MMMRLLILMALLATAAQSQPISAADPSPGPPAFGAALPAGTTAYANESLADLFVGLTHDLEWGGRRPHLVRYEGAVSVGVSGPGSARYAAFLEVYLAELRARAGVPIARGPAPHNLLIRFVPGDEFRKRLPRHYCVVAPLQPDWDTFSRKPRRYGTRPFERAATPLSMTVFIPDNAAPYLVRACLIEEIAQALGPANDYYGLGSSIFNDDAAHVWPTKLDYLLMRILYAPEMRTGLDRRETRALALTLLDRLNPQGRDAPPLPPLRVREMADWVETMRDAFDRSRPTRKRLKAAHKALAIAERRAPGSAHHCRSLQALARAAEGDRDTSLRALDDAGLICAVAHGADDIRLAQIRLDRARLLFQAGRPGDAQNAIEGLEAIFTAHGQEERLTALYDLKAASLRAMHRTAESVGVLRQAMEWRGFALGDGGQTGGRWTGE